jgi:hypothetical protein
LESLRWRALARNSKLERRATLPDVNSTIQY